MIQNTSNFPRRSFYRVSHWTCRRKKGKYNNILFSYYFNYVLNWLKHNLLYKTNLIIDIYIYIYCFLPYNNSRNVFGVDNVLQFSSFNRNCSSSLTHAIRLATQNKALNLTTSLWPSAFSLPEIQFSAAISFSSLH